MRSRKEIESELKVPSLALSKNTGVIAEILLDIRDLLDDLNDTIQHGSVEVHKG